MVLLGRTAIYKSELVFNGLFISGKLGLFACNMLPKDDIIVARTICTGIYRNRDNQNAVNSIAYVMATIYGSYPMQTYRRYWCTHTEGIGAHTEGIGAHTEGIQAYLQAILAEKQTSYLNGWRAQ